GGQIARTEHRVLLERQQLDGFTGRVDGISLATEREVSPAQRSSRPKILGMITQPRLQQLPRFLSVGFGVCKISGEDANAGFRGSPLPVVAFRHRSGFA